MYLIQWGRGQFYPHYRYGSGFGSFLVYFDKGFLLQQANVQILICIDQTKIGPLGIESRCHTQSRHGRYQFFFVFQIETGQFKIKFRFPETMQPVSPTRSVEGFNQCIHINTLAGQNKYHAESLVPEGQFYNLNGLVFVIRKFRFLIHHIHLGLFAAGQIKIGFFGFGFIEFMYPTAFEIECVKQKHNVVRVNIVEDFIDSTLGFYIAPIVYGI
ncbi:MAG: hypothetical protein BWX77_01559 [Bacteroidetes bacterium ADurb.Bin090]|nr:MAG: hypothetical protein BWX77_01559 [Bacteroidetes bacterium ADurb.Bin090]